MNIKSFSINFSMNNELAKKTVCSLFLAYAFFMLYVCIHIEARVPDENWFWGLSRDIHWHHSIKEMFMTENYLGYGALYWQILKVIKSLLFARLLWGSMLISIPVCVILFCKKVLCVPNTSVLAAIILYLSCPLSWFTGKIIGPEILGQFFGCWGTLFLFMGYKKTQYSLIAIGALAIGLASGIKLYNGFFAAFCGLYILQEEIHRKDFKALAKIALICFGVFALGFCIGGGLGMIANSPLYKKNLPHVSKFSFAYMLHILFGQSFAWDLVNCGGMSNTIMNVPSCIVLFLLSFVSRENRFLKFSCMFTTMLLILSCCFSGQFLGWYLLPMIFVLSLLASSAKFIFPLLIVNLVLVFVPLSYQIGSKVEQIKNIKNIDALKLHVSNWQKQYDDSYKSYIFVELCDALPFTYGHDENTVKQLLFISNRALACPYYKTFFDMAKEKRNGYSLLDYKDGVWFCKFEKDVPAVLSE